MYLDIVLAGWIVWGLIALYSQNHAWRLPVFRSSSKGGTTQEPACKHPQVEQVEVGDGILVPREVVAKVCTSCYARLPAEYVSPSSVIITTEESAPFPYHTIDFSYWTESTERLATGKDKKCHE